MEQKEGQTVMTNEEAKTFLVNLYAEWHRRTFIEDSPYAEAVAVAISALERAGDGNGKV